MPDAQAEEEAFIALLAQLFDIRVEQLADPEQRVVLASAVPEQLVLHPSSHLVHRTVGEANDMERIGDSQSAVELGADAGR